MRGKDRKKHGRFYMVRCFVFVKKLKSVSINVKSFSTTLMGNVKSTKLETSSLYVCRLHVYVIENNLHI